MENNRTYKKDIKDKMLGWLPTLPYRNDTLEKRNGHERMRLYLISYYFNL